MAFLLAGLAFLIEEAVVAAAAVETVAAVTEVAVGVGEVAAGVGEVAVGTIEAAATEEAVATGVLGTLPSEAAGTGIVGELTDAEISLMASEDVLGPGGEILPSIAETEAGAQIDLAAEAEVNAIMEQAEQRAILSEVAASGGALPEGASALGIEGASLVPEEGFNISAGSLNAQADIFNAAFEEQIAAGEFSGLPYYDIPDGVTFLEEATEEGFTLNVEPWRTRPIYQGSFTPEEVLKGLADISNIATAVNTTGQTINGLIDLYRDSRKPAPMADEIINRDGYVHDPYEMGYDLGIFLSVSEKYMAQGRSDVDSFVLTVNERPELLYLLETVYKFDHEEAQMDVDQFLSGYEEYDGRNLNGDAIYSKMVDGQEIFCALDEFGSEHCYTYRRGQQTPIWGTYVGPFSPNGDNIGSTEYPGKGNGTLLDVFAFFHDCDYGKYGFFSLEGDKKFLNRIKNNFDRMGSAERAVAKSVFLYFSTIGYSLSLLKTKIVPPNIDTKVSTVIANDIFFQLTGTQSGEARTRFYQGLRKGLSDNFRIAGSFQGPVSEMKMECKNQLMDLPILYVK